MARAKQYSNEQIIAALKKRRGLIHLAAKTLGCMPNTIYARARASPEVSECLKNCRGEIVDIAEDKLFISLNKRESWAIALVLKTLGKDRGYVEKAELDLSLLSDDEAELFHKLFAKATGFSL